MPSFVYKAITTGKNIVKNKVEDSSKYNLMKKLKRNGLIPISVKEIKSKKFKDTKRNIKDMDSMAKNLNSGDIARKRKNSQRKTLEKLNYMLFKSDKITNRDLVIFTQNFYLLKKANFNNIHALNTLIEGTENRRLRGILEDILARCGIW